MTRPRPAPPAPRSGGDADDAPVAPPPSAAALSPSGRAAAVQEARLDLLDAAARFASASEAGKTEAEAAFCRRYTARELALAPYGLAERHHALVPKLAARTLRRWRAALEEGGPSVLVPRRGRQAGRLYPSYFSEHPEEGAFVRALLLRYGPALTARQVRLLMASREAARGHEPGAGPGAPPLPSERAIQRFKRAFAQEHPQLADYLADPDAWKGRHLTALGRADEAATRLAEVWEVDATPADVLLRSEGGRLRRHAVVAVVEVYSRLPLLLVAPAESAYGALRLLRKAFLTWRRFPERVRIDGGSAYRSRAFRAALGRLEIAVEPLPPHAPELQAVRGAVLPHVQRGAPPAPARLRRGRRGGAEGAPSAARLGPRTGDRRRDGAGAHPGGAAGDLRRLRGLLRPRAPARGARGDAGGAGGRVGPAGATRTGHPRGGGRAVPARLHAPPARGTGTERVW